MKTNARIRPWTAFSLVFLAIAILAAGCQRATWTETRGRDRQDTTTGNPQTNPQTNPTANAPVIPQTFRHPPVAFQDCVSQTLEVQVGTVDTQDNLTDYQTTLKRYPLVTSAKTAEAPEQTTFVITANDLKQQVCTDTVCAEAAGWTQLQDDLMDLNDVSVKCSGAADDPNATPAPTPVPSDSGEGDGWA